MSPSFAVFCCTASSSLVGRSAGRSFANKRRAPSASLPLLFRAITGVELPRPVAVWTDRIRRFGIGNAYHVFPTMQTERIELVIEGSHDGRQWQPYRLRWQPVEPSRAPAFILPHQPRLDWMMWFVPTQAPPGTIVFDQLIRRLVEDSQPVGTLLADNPFATRAPRHIRVLAYRYRFTTAAERAASGLWWQREYLGIFPFIPPRQP